MHVEGLCNLCVLRLCNTYVERLVTYMCSGCGLVIPCMEGFGVLEGPGCDSSAVSPGMCGASVCCSVKWMP